MAIDARIALGVQPVQQQPNMLAQYAQVMGIKAAQQEMEGNNALRDAYAQGGDLNDPAFRQRVMAANPRLGSQLIKTNAETGKLQNEAVLKRIELSREMLTGVNTPEDYLAWHESNHKDPVLGGYLNQRGVTAEQSRAKIMAALNTPGGLEKLKRESALGAGKLQQELMQTERTRISAGPGYMNANLAQKEFELRQKQQAEIDAISGGNTSTPSTTPMGGGGGGVPSTAPMTGAAPTGGGVPNALAPNAPPAASSNMLAPGAQTPAAAPELTGDLFDRIKAIDAQIAKYPINNPRSIPILQALNAQRTQLLASAKQQYNGQLVDMEMPDPKDPTRFITVKGQIDQYGIAQPLRTGGMPIDVDISTGKSIDLPVARPAPSAAVLKERQLVERLPEAIAMNNDAIRKIDEMIGGVDANGKPLAGAKGKPHPGFGEAVGAAFGTAYIPGTQGKSFTIRHKEVLSQAFLDAFEALKGGGAITEKEGEKATAARTRMDLSQSESEYMAAAREYQGVLKRGVENARARMQRSGIAPPTPTTATPETNVIEFGSLK
jgi:hypothetical protein